MAEFDFVYRKYSEDETKIYEKAIKEVLLNIKNGMSLKDAIENVQIDNQEIKNFVEDDALKILIAELCYVSKIPFEELAKMLDIPVERVRQANFEMLEDIELTLNNTFRKRRAKGDA